MIVTAPLAAHEHLTKLAWDSENFGFPVAKIATPRLDNISLREVLCRAKVDGMRLVFWPAAADQAPPATILKEFAGSLVERRVSYGADLSQISDAAEPGAFETHTYGEASPSASLVELSIAAGVSSRFSVDPRFPKDKFRSLYRIWIERSVCGPMADVVLVANQRGSNVVDGMLTMSLSAGVGTIGLVAVSERVRGKGLGKILMAQAHRWLARRLASRCNVVTQLENVAACKLYERCGYRASDVQHYYHFWL